MTDQTNGHQNGNGAAPAPQDASQAVSAQQQQILRNVELGISHVVSTMVRGIMSSAPGVPPQLLLTFAAFHTGEALIGSVTSDLPQMLALRKMVKDQFEKGIQSVKLAPPAVAANGLTSLIKPPGA